MSALFSRNTGHADLKYYKRNTSEPYPTAVLSPRLACPRGKTALGWGSIGTLNKQIPRAESRGKDLKNEFHEKPNSVWRSCAVRAKNSLPLPDHMWLPRTHFETRWCFSPLPFHVSASQFSFHLGSLCRRCQRPKVPWEILHFTIRSSGMKSLIHSLQTTGLLFLCLAGN